MRLRPFLAARLTKPLWPALVGMAGLCSAWALGLILPLNADASAGPASGEPSLLLTSYSAGLKNEFPDVPVISTSELRALSPSPVLLDVREPEEFGVSRIPGARLAGPDILDELKKDGIGPQADIVVYCSVGYRSAKLARKLSAAGYLHIRNLEGSIFQWANEGLPLVNDSGPTTGVHPYNKKWGQLLEPGRWAWNARNP